MKAGQRTLAPVVPMRVRASKPRGPSDMQIRTRLANRLTRLDIDQLLIVELVVQAILRGDGAGGSR